MRRALDDRRVMQIFDHLNGGIYFLDEDVLLCVGVAVGVVVGASVGSVVAVGVGDEVGADMLVGVFVGRVIETPGRGAKLDFSGLIAGSGLESFTLRTPKKYMLPFVRPSTRADEPVIATVKGW